MPKQKSNRRILIVDDERAIADTLTLIFTMQHYDARAVYSAEGAIETLAKWRPDLAILDVILPEMNGIDLAIVIKANYRVSCAAVLGPCKHGDTVGRGWTQRASVRSAGEAGSSNRDAGESICSAGICRRTSLRLILAESQAAHCNQPFVVEVCFSTSDSICSTLSFCS
jgi:CheY-like chemotaxis protein